MHKIAVTGVGGGVGQSIIKSLYNTEYDLIGLDGELLGAGLYSVPKSHIIPYAKSPDFIPALLEICEKEKVSLLFPGLDAELPVFAKNRQLFKDAGTTIVVSEPEVISIADDKLETYSSLTALGVKVPFTDKLESFDLSSGVLSFPFIIKQRVGGARSKNVFIIKNQKDWINTISLLDSKENYIVQEYIEGDEYTCGSINLDGECRGVIVMRRVLRDGDTYKCFTEKNEIIENTVRTIVNAIKPFGACNIQLRIKDGIPYVFEINARCSGTTAARTLSGFNEPRMIADYLLKNIKPTFEIKLQTILRYWSELVIENGSVESLAKNRSSLNKDFKSL